MSHISTNPLICITTSLGEITAELFIDKAPITVNNFLTYVAQQRFDDSSIFRIVNETNPEQAEDYNAKIQVVQCGIMPEESNLLPPIAHESTQQTGLKHLDGTLSMARFAPGTADGSFFFCINDQPELNFGGKRYDDGLGFAAFGQLRTGREVLDSIYHCAEDKEYLRSPIPILSIRLINPM